MSRKRKYKKVTTVSKGLFGEKRIETEWIPEGSGCGALVVLGLLLLFFLRGCG